MQAGRLAETIVLRRSTPLPPSPLKRRSSWPRFWCFTIRPGDISNKWPTQPPRAPAPREPRWSVKRVPELVSPEIADKAHYKLDQKAPVATVEELAEYDAIIFGTPTRYGNMAAQMKNFLDQTGALWASGALVGKVGSVFASSATQHGGQESTILTFHPGPAAPRFRRRRPALCFRRADGRIGGHGQFALWRLDHRRPAMAPVSRARSNSTAPASRAGMWPRSPPSWRA